MTLYHVYDDYDKESLGLYRAAGYNFTLTRIDREWLERLSERCPMGGWLREPSHQLGRYYYSHLTDYLRFCLLYLEGGLYTDLDALLIRPLHDLISSVPSHKKIVIGKDVIGRDEACDWCLGDGRQYLAPGIVYAKGPGSLVFKEALHMGFGADYSSEVFGCAGPQAITRAYKRSRAKAEVEVLQPSAFYPLNWENAHRLFKRDGVSEMQWTEIKRRSWSAHLYGSTTGNLTVEEGSVVHRLVKSDPAAIRMQDEHATVEVGKPIGSALGVRDGDKVQIDSITVTGESVRAINQRLRAVQLSIGEPYRVSNVTVYRNGTVLDHRPLLVANLEKSITVVTKTFGRMEKVMELVDSIARHYRDHLGLKILIGNDGHDAHGMALAFSDIKGVKYVPFEYDIGLSEGRNRLLKLVDTEYVLMLDDDFVFTEQSDILKLLRTAVLGGFDIVGGKSPNDVGTFQFEYCGLLSTTLDGVLELEAGDRGSFEGCQAVDFVPNLFVAKTSALCSVGWDSALKLGEHEDFFLRAKAKGLRVATCPHTAFSHRQARFWEARSEYDRMRLRVYSFIAQALRKHGLVELRTMGRTVLRLMEISQTPILSHRILDTWQGGVKIQVFPDKEYYSYRAECNGRTIDAHEPLLTLNGLEPGEGCTVKVRVGNRTGHQSEPYRIALATGVVLVDLLTDGSFDRGSPRWKGSLGTPFNFVETAIEPKSKTKLRGRSDGMALGISTVSQSQLRPHASPLHYHFSVYQAIEKTGMAPDGCRLKLSGWSLPDKIHWVYGPLLGYRLQLEIEYEGLPSEMSPSEDFDARATEWHARAASLAVKDGQKIARIIARIVFDAPRGGAFFDDLSLALDCE